MKRLGELLIEQGKLSERDVERALLAQAEMGDRFGQVLVKLGLVSEQDVAQALSRQQCRPRRRQRRGSQVCRHRAPGYLSGQGPAHGAGQTGIGCSGPGE